MAGDWASRSGQMSFICLFTLALFCVNVEFPVLEGANPPPPISKWRRRMVELKWPRSQIVWPVCPIYSLLCTPYYTPTPGPPASPQFPWVYICCPVSIWKRCRSKSVHGLLFFCNGLETAKCSGLWYLRAHKSGLPRCLPPRPPHHFYLISSLPLT